MKRLIPAIILATAAITAQAEGKVTKSEATAVKLGVEMVQKAVKEDNLYLSCIYFRTALIQFKSVEHNMKDGVAKVRDMEQRTCKKAGVALPKGTF